MIKEGRLQLRIDDDLKNWFKNWSLRQGGMSSYILSHIKSLKTREMSAKQPTGGSDDSTKK